MISNILNFLSCDFTRLINQQINYEQTAANFYHQMSYKFRHPDQVRPNFSKMLKKRAKEETEHAQIFADFQEIVLKFHTSLMIINFISFQFLISDNNPLNSWNEEHILNSCLFQLKGKISKVCSTFSKLHSPKKKNSAKILSRLTE